MTGEKGERMVEHKQERQPLRIGAYVRKRHSCGEPGRIVDYDTLHEWVEVAGGARIDWDDCELVEPAPVQTSPSPQVAQASAWVPKVGDRVRVCLGRHRGKVGSVSAPSGPGDGWYVALDGAVWGYQASELEPAPTEQASERPTREQFIAWFDSMPANERAEVWWECEAQTADEVREYVAQLQEENARLRQELEDVRALDDYLATGADVDIAYLGPEWDLELRDAEGQAEACFTEPTVAAARRAAVEHLKSKEKP